jgi:hypothetical protein
MPIASETLVPRKVKMKYIAEIRFLSLLPEGCPGETLIRSIALSHRDYSRFYAGRQIYPVPSRRGDGLLVLSTCNSPHRINYDEGKCLAFYDILTA